MRKSGTIALITGGGSGIGLALALAAALIELGNEVVICGRSRERLQGAKTRLAAVQTVVCDITRSRSRVALVDRVRSRFEGINLVVNNAGIQRPVDFLRGRRDLGDADAEVATNLVGPVHLSALLIPHLRRASEAAIVNISSGLAFTPLASVPVYCATKAAVHSLSLSLRHQLRDTPVRVFEIAPPIVATGLSGNRPRPEEAEWTMSAEAVASAMIAAIENDQYEVALGVAAGLHARRDALFSMLR